MSLLAGFFIGLERLGEILMGPSEWIAAVGILIGLVSGAAAALHRMVSELSAIRITLIDLRVDIQEMWKRHQQHDQQFNLLGQRVASLEATRGDRE